MGLAAACSALRGHCPCVIALVLRAIITFSLCKVSNSQLCTPSHNASSGTLDRDNRTLYISYEGAGSYELPKIRQLLEANFKLWGPVNNIYIVHPKNIAFVRCSIYGAGRNGLAAAPWRTMLCCVMKGAAHSICRIAAGLGPHRCCSLPSMYVLCRLLPLPAGMTGAPVRSSPRRPCTSSRCWAAAWARW